MNLGLKWRDGIGLVDGFNAVIRAWMSLDESHPRGREGGVIEEMREWVIRRETEKEGRGGE